jgi:hypothetical protein
LTLVVLIVTGRIEEGALLPPEGQLCEHFGVSRTVLRESMKRRYSPRRRRLVGQMMRTRR